MEENELTEKIIRCAIKVYKTLKPGLLESSNLACRYYELVKSGLIVEKEKALPVIYEEVKLDCGYRIDFLMKKEL